MALDKSKNEVIPLCFPMLLCEATKRWDSIQCININPEALQRNNKSRIAAVFFTMFVLFLFEDSFFNSQHRRYPLRR